MRDDPQHVWLEQLRIWRDSGAFKRIDEAEQAGTWVTIPRSDGSTSLALIDPRGGGCGGRLIGVKWETNAGEKRYKDLHTDVLIDLNPQLFVGLTNYKGPRGD